MKLIIKIPDHLYELLKAIPSDSDEGTIENVLMKAVENGTPLPKGHGRLIDADALQAKPWFNCDLNENDAPTIIKADKAVEE